MTSNSLPTVNPPSDVCDARGDGVESALRVHLTNVTGLGATQLAKSLLPALERVPGLKVVEIYLPESGELATYRRSLAGKTTVYRRVGPKSVSRMLECTLFGHRFDGPTPLLVLGDLPLRTSARQIVFVQTPLLLSAADSRAGVRTFIYQAARWVFRRNLRYASAFIVQTEAMRAALAGSYPEIEEKLHVLAQPVPTWLQSVRRSRSGRTVPSEYPLDLVYPARSYPHKNHALLSRIAPKVAKQWPMRSLTLTIGERENPNPSLPWLRCVGELAPEGMQSQYGRTDGVIFLSVAESYGFPLVEAMWVGLPIVCPDLPYARTLCGSEGIYFDVNSVESLQRAVMELMTRLRCGWWPCWDERLRRIPEKWDDVAEAIAQVVRLQ